MGIYGDLLKLNQKTLTAEPQTPGTPPAVPVEPTPGEPKTPLAPQAPPLAVAKPRHPATVPPRDRGITVSRYHDPFIQAVRRAVKLFGKEAATHRFTQDEKKAIAHIVYTYKLHDLKTSENEITRIGVNFIISDYQENGESSVLHRVLAALNS